MNYPNTLRNTHYRYSKKIAEDASKSKWKAYLVHTVTGSIVSELSIEEGSYSIPLNDIETLSATIVKNDLPEKTYKEMLRPCNTI